MSWNAKTPGRSSSCSNLQNMSHSTWLEGKATGGENRVWKWAPNQESMQGAGRCRWQACSSSTQATGRGSTRQTCGLSWSIWKGVALNWELSIRTKGESESLLPAIPGVWVWDGEARLEASYPARKTFLQAGRLSVCQSVSTGPDRMPR